MLKEKVAKAVSLTPSGDNTQPFELEWIGQVARISHNDELAKHKLNPGNYASLLSLGCLLENVRVGALSEGYDMFYEFNEKHPLKPFVINFKPAGKKDDRLLVAMSERCTDRRGFKKADISDALTVLERVKTEEYSAKAKILPELPKNVFDFIMKSDTCLWKDIDIFLDTVHWIRFTKKEALRTRDGMPFKNLGLNFFTKNLIWLACQSRFTLEIFRKTGGEIEGQKMIKRQLTSASGFLFINVKEKNPVNIVEAGRLAQRIWLELTNLGYGVQPLTLPTLMTFTAIDEALPELRPEVVEIFKEGAEVMKKELDLPAWGFRFGRIGRLPDSARTYRRA